jgi:hypothetical protein
VGAGFKTGKIYLHPHQFYNLVASKLGAIQLDNSRTVELGINSMKLGQFTFVEAPFADVRYAHIVGEGNLEMHTCGNQPTIGKAFDDPDTDQTKVKLNLDGNLLTYAPCQNVRVKLPSVTIS